MAPTAKRARTLHAFFAPPPAKKVRVQHEAAAASAIADQAPEQRDTPTPFSTHPAYPFPVPHLPPSITDILKFAPAEEGRVITDQPHLDLLYYQPYMPCSISRSYFDFLRRELFFYRVKYTVKRGATETLINTPRYTTVFGLDETSRFNADGRVLDCVTGKPVGQTAYRCKPRPIPECLDMLRRLTESATGCRFNFCLVNYYASGSDSISYHSDDEHFLAPEPAIASFSLGATRDFLLKHKPTEAKHSSETKPTKLPLASGDMVLMRGKTQANWLHSIPKRTAKGGEAEKGRINITFRRAMVKGGTENYYRYNVGEGEVFKWDAGKGEMVVREKERG